MKDNLNYINSKRGGQGHFSYVCYGWNNHENNEPIQENRAELEFLPRPLKSLFMMQNFIQLHRMGLLDFIMSSFLKIYEKIKNKSKFQNQSRINQDYKNRF